MTRTPEPGVPMRSVHTVCLIKGCAGTTVDRRSWGGVILLRTHEHDPTPDTPRRRGHPPP
ncbi:hypothetical protein [Streptomyces cyaneofuscatus]|uniref:hypothetical protein n=1 Tax=Streptomyces cyaneofuscatus TaxID=66883 RepID=UPI00380DF3CE